MLYSSLPLLLLVILLALCLLASVSCPLSSFFSASLTLPPLSSHGPFSPLAMDYLLDLLKMLLMYLDVLHHICTIILSPWLSLGMVRFTFSIQNVQALRGMREGRDIDLRSPHLSGRDFKMICPGVCVLASVGCLNQRMLFILCRLLREKKMNVPENLLC